MCGGGGGGGEKSIRDLNICSRQPLLGDSFILRCADGEDLTGVGQSARWEMVGWSCAAVV